MKTITYVIQWQESCGSPEPRPDRWANAAFVCKSTEEAITKISKCQNKNPEFHYRVVRQIVEESVRAIFYP